MKSPFAPAQLYVGLFAVELAYTLFVFDTAASKAQAGMMVSKDRASTGIDLELIDINC